MNKDIVDLIYMNVYANQHFTALIARGIVIKIVIITDIVSMTNAFVKKDLEVINVNKNSEYLVVIQ